VLVFAISLQLNVIAFLTEPADDISLAQVFSDETVVVKPNRDDLPMSDLILKFPVDEIMRSLVYEYFLYFLTVVLPDYQYMSRLFNLRLRVENFHSEKDVIFKDKQSNNRKREGNH